MKSKGIVNISGISESRVAPVAAYILKGTIGQSLIIVSSPIRAKRLACDLSFFIQKNIYILPAEDELFLRYEAKNHDELLERMRVLKALRTGEDCVVIAPVSAAIKKLPPHKNFEENSLRLTRGETVDLEEIKRHLALMGYERVNLVDGRGQFGIRGSILDFFTADGDAPYRIELFDTEIDSIRTFDLDTQRSIENLKYIEVYPAEQLLVEDTVFDAAAKKIDKEYTAYIKRYDKEATADSYQCKEDVSESDTDAEKAEVHRKRIKNLVQRRDSLLGFVRSSTNVQLLENYLHYFYEETEYLWDYMKDESAIMIDDPDRIMESLEARSHETKEDFKALLERGLVIPKDFKIFSDKQDYLKLYLMDNVYLFTPFQKPVKGVERFSALHNLQSRQTAVFNGRMDMLESELKNYIKNDYKVTIVCANDERIANLREFLQRCNLSEQVWLEKGELTGGIDFPIEKLCYIWDGDIFISQKHSKRKHKGGKDSKHAGKAIQTFADMKKGDFVVHENHGIGKFLGIEQLTVQNIKKDYLKIKYAGEDMLYVPVEQMDIIQKYVGADSATPKINKLSSGEWKKTKARAKAAIANMAKELLELSAARQLEKGHAFSEDTVWQREFEDSFPHNETDDQLRCIKEIKADMERAIAMDRLLCGDVGFGKTEVAARAMFKCIADGKQAAVLVPTTILANQHYYTMKERFERFPFTVEMLSRFRSASQQDAIIEKMGKGMVDVVIGTHRILSKDIKFKDLGLLVIDEEQRFGVQHKEAIKLLRKNVDVLTLSATPIPRTLHMSLVGIKDMSLIEEPPEERYPVQTYVLEQDDQLIKEVVERELGRGGQVYVVFNRVQGIHKIASSISKLVPEAKVAIGHGQMNERELEDVMLDFVNNEINVLIATTIIESGIDIPNVNTILILDADRFGLSQLYQLRGRVGRSNRMAYAYLMYQRDKVLSEVAEKRLRAIKEFTEFGAGFKVAMRDLEIRGAGNLLGMEQHGHMMMIGYELYCKLVDDAIRALGGEVINPDREESSIELQVTAFIPDGYIGDEVLKLQMYKRIASIGDADDEGEIIDELLDRFGEIPKETIDLIKVSRIRAIAEKLCITRIHEEQVSVGGRSSSKIVFDFAEKNTLKTKALSNLISSYGSRVFIHGGVKPFIKCNLKGRNKLVETIEILEKMQIPDDIKKDIEKDIKKGVNKDIKKDM